MGLVLRLAALGCQREALLAPGLRGLFPLLVMWGSLAPALLAPLQPICDSRVMDRFIQEASKAERDVGPFCNASCDLPAAVTGPDTKVNFQQWTAMPAVIGSREQDVGPASTPHLSIRTWRKLFSTYSGFLRGKVNLYITAACRVNAR
ncbi:hypothetical protein lerEdw1_006440 [Lerista edwardsae]|nr:hypothetical protein lerEdw1_006440 [Lerista edwardsae]